MAQPRVAPVARQPASRSDKRSPPLREKPENDRTPAAFGHSDDPKQAGGLHHGEDRKQGFLAIAGRDAGVQAVNAALRSGSKVQNLKLAPRVVSWKEATPLCALSEIAPATVKKAWRLFWRGSRGNL